MNSKITDNEECEETTCLSSPYSVDNLFKGENN